MLLLVVVSVHDFSPEPSSAHQGSTSDLLRFHDRMAASKPTSWLSLPCHFLFHSVMVWGPYRTIWAVSLLTSDLITWSLSGDLFMCIRSFLGLGQALGHPCPSSALPTMKSWSRSCITKSDYWIWICNLRSTSIDFAENQLFPSLISLSPLATSHPCILQHTWVRSSKMCYHIFNLLMARSLGFGSYCINACLPFEKSFSLRLHLTA